jgi:mannose-6-phosphate isomerase-like protein (cupin superfamily)
VHPVSDQLLLVMEGRLHIQTGPHQLHVETGRLVWLPRQCRHRLRAGKEGCRFWEIIAPNREPYQLSGALPAESEHVQATVYELSTNLTVPASPDLRVEILHLPPRSNTSRQTLHEQERLWCVLGGSPMASLRTLSGRLDPHTILHIPREYSHQLRNQHDKDCFVLEVTLPRH